MKPIDFIGLKNFRVFDDQNGIFEELSSINLLTGTNNSGKSSIIKSLQMLKNSVQGSKIPFDLDLTEQEHLLGDFENVLNNTKNRNIEISLPFTFLGITTIYSTLVFNIPIQDNSYKGYLRKITITDKKDNTDLFSFSYREATNEEIESDITQHQLETAEHHEFISNLTPTTPEDIFINSFNIPPSYSKLVGYIEWSINVEKLKFYLTGLLEFYNHYLKHKNDEKYLNYADTKSEETFLIASLLIKSLKSDKLVESWTDFLANGMNTEAFLEGKEPIVEDDLQGYDFFMPAPKIEEILYHNSKDILDKNLKWNNSTEPAESYYVISECFQSSYKELIRRISTINYLSTVKEENSRIYIGTNNSPFINLLKDYHSLDINTKFINKYLKAFDIGTEIKVDFERKYQVINVSITSLQFQRRDLVDFGYGIKQLVLVLMQISVLAKKNKRTKEVYDEYGNHSEKTYYVPSLLLIEEPETNLHPKWQSLLAEMFAKANKKYNIQLVIETHSEYLIRKFQTLTAQGKINSKKVKIFYLRDYQAKKEGRKQLETIFIEPDGIIDYKLFDGGFFDEADNLELSLLNIQRDHFFSDFEALKANKEENENKISDLQLKIDHYTNKADLGVYQSLVSTIFVNTSKLRPDSLRYLTSGQFLLHNIDDQGDFSPVILQYGRSVEQELCNLFTNIDPIKEWKIGVMQGGLEKFKFGNTVVTPCSNVEFALLQTELAATFNTPLDLKIELLNDLRIKRNDAAHPGPPRTKMEAIDYMNATNEFLQKWIELKK